MLHVQCRWAGVSVHPVTQGQQLVDPPQGDVHLQDDREYTANHTPACKVCVTSILLATVSHVVLPNLKRKCAEGEGK